MLSLDALVADEAALFFHDYRRNDARDISGQGRHGSASANLEWTGDGVRFPKTNSWLRVASDAAIQAVTEGCIFFYGSFSMDPSHGFLTGYGYAQFPMRNSSSHIYARYGYDSADPDTRLACCLSYYDLELNGRHTLAINFADGEPSDWYVDGVYHGSSAGNCDLTTNSDPIYIGNAGTSDYAMREATFHATGLFNRPLTAGEIAALHADVIAEKYDTRRIIRRSRLTLTDPLGLRGITPVSSYPNPFVDSVGNNDGTQLGAVDIEATRIGLAACGNGIGLVNLGDFALSMTHFFASFYYTHKSATASIVSQAGASGDGFGIRVATDALSVHDDIDNHDTSLYATTLTVGQTYHIVFGINASNAVKLWINGIPAANNASATAAFSTLTGTSLILLGRFTATPSCLGSISNLEFFDRDMSDADVASIYSRLGDVENGFGALGTPVIHTAVTSSGAALWNTGFLLSASSSVTIISNDTVERAFYFGTGTSSNIWTTNAMLGIAKGAPVGTWKFRVLIESNGATKMRLGFVNDHGSSADTGYHVEISAANGVELKEGGTVHVAQAATAGEWQDVEVSRNYNGAMRLFVGGTYVGTVTDTTYTTSRYFRIYCNYGYGYFDLGAFKFSPWVK